MNTHITLQMLLEYARETKHEEFNLDSGSSCLAARYSQDNSPLGTGYMKDFNTFEQPNPFETVDPRFAVFTENLTRNSVLEEYGDTFVGDVWLTKKTTIETLERLIKGDPMQTIVDDVAQLVFGEADLL